MHTLFSQLMCVLHIYRYYKNLRVRGLECIYESKNQLQDQTSLEVLRDVTLTLGPVSDPYLPSSALHGPHRLSCDFKQSEKPALEKQTSQLSLVMPLCMSSVWVQSLVEAIKWNRPSVTFWSVFQYSVTLFIYSAKHLGIYKEHLQMIHM